ncbi:MAG: hypothetical protein AAB491_01680 [Patescibacteria group bacterium]
MPDFIDPIFNEDDEDVGTAGDLDEETDDISKGDSSDDDSGDYGGKDLE